jgi:hypothetical protein
MADDMLIGVGVKADFSSLKTESKSSAEALRAATQNMAQALQELGPAAAAGSAQAIAALQVYKTELAQAQAAVADIVPVLEAEAAAEEADAAATTANAAAHGRMVPQVAAASGAIRLLEGALPIRAVERFTVNVLGLGPIIQAAFPIIGAIAFGEMMIHIGSKLRDMYTDLLGIKQLRDDIAKGTDKDVAQQGAAEAATRAQLHSLAMETSPIATIKADIKNQNDLVDFLQKKINKARDDAKQLRQAAADANPTFGQNPEKLKMEAASQEARVPGLQAQMEKAQSQIMALQQKYTDEKDKEAKAAEQAEEKKQRAIEKTAAAQRKEEAARKKAQEDYIHAFENDEKVKEANRGLFDEQNRNAVAVLGDGLTVLQKQTEEQERQLQIQLEINVLKTKSAMDAALGQNQSRQQGIRNLASAGGMGRGEEAAQLAELVKEKIAIQNAYYDALEALYSKDSVEWQRLEVQRLATLQKDNAQLSILAGKQGAEFAKGWTKAFDQIGHQWIQVQGQMLRGQLSISQAFRRLGSEMLLSVIQAYEQMLMHDIRYKTQKVASTVATEAETTVVTAAGTAAKDNIETMSALKSIYKHAKTAAAKSFDWASAWGGPIAGAIFGAAAFTGVMALAAFDQGGIVSGPLGSAIPILAHSGERVLTASQNNTFERMVSGGGGGHTINNGGNTFNGIADAATFKKMLAQHERSLAQTTMKSIRNGRFRPA